MLGETIEFSADIQGDFSALREMCLDETMTIYIEVDGATVPVADIKRHPDCPKELFEKFLKALLYESQER